MLRVYVGWFALYFAFLFSQSYRTFNFSHKQATEGKTTSLAKIKYSTDGGRYTLTGNRTVGNMLEQSVPFLASLALHAVLVDAAKAAQLGWLWLLSRAIYPFVFAKGPPLLFVSTLPGYGFIGALLWPVGALAFA